MQLPHFLLIFTIKKLRYTWRYTWHEDVKLCLVSLQFEARSNLNSSLPVLRLVQYCTFIILIGSAMAHRASARCMRKIPGVHKLVATSERLWARSCGCSGPALTSQWEKETAKTQVQMEVNQIQETRRKLCSHLLRNFYVFLQCILSRQPCLTINLKLQCFRLGWALALAC